MAEPGLSQFRPRGAGLADLEIPPELMPLFLQAAQAGGGNAPVFPDAPMSRADAAAQQSMERWSALAEAVKNDPAGFVGMLGMPGLGASMVMRGAQNYDPAAPSEVKGTMSLGGKAQQGKAPAKPSASETQAQSADDILPTLLAQKTALQASIDAAGKRADLEKKTGSGPKWQEAVATQKTLVEQMKGLDDQIKEEQAARKEKLRQASPEYQTMIQQGATAASKRDTAIANQRGGYEADAPLWLQKAQAFLPAAVPAALHAGLEVADAIKNRSTAGKWASAIEAARGAADKGGKATEKLAGMARGADESAAFAAKNQPPGWWTQTKRIAGTAGAGGVEGSALANIPEAYNFFLPGVNQERAAWETYLKELPANHPDRANAEAIIKTMPTSTPQRDAALAHFTSPSVLARIGEGFAEGAGGSFMGKNIVKIGDALIPGGRMPREAAVSLEKEYSGVKKAAKAEEKAEAAAAEAAAAAKAERAAARAARNRPPGLAEMSFPPPPPPAALLPPPQRLLPAPSGAENVIRDTWAARSGGQEMPPELLAEILRKWGLQ